MDAYGPRVPIGGGALHGKHKGHVDRVGFEWAREEALRRVRAGEGEVLFRGWFGPGLSRACGIDGPLELV